VSFHLSVEGFPEGGKIPVRFTCDGEDAHPALSWEGEPRETLSFALIMDDPDAPGGTWNHWLLWDIPATTHALPEGKKRLPIGIDGTNDFGRIGYGGPCPPKGRGEHRYYVRLFALNAHTLGLSRGARRAALQNAIKQHAIAEATYMGRFGH